MGAPYIYDISNLRVKVPRPETFSSERSVTIRKTQLSKSNRYINTLGKNNCDLKKMRITTVK